MIVLVECCAVVSCSGCIGITVFCGYRFVLQYNHKLVPNVTLELIDK